LDDINVSTFLELISKYEIAKRNVKCEFYHKVTDILFDSTVVKAWRRELLRIYYRLEDFMLFVNTRIDDRLLCNKDILQIEKYNNMYEVAKQGYENGYQRVRKLISKEISIPGTRDLKLYPVEVFSDVINEESLVEETTLLLEAPTDTNESDSLTYVTAMTRHQDNMILNIAPGDVSLYLSQQNNIIAVKRTLIRTDQNKQIYDNVMSSHEGSLHESSEVVVFPLVGFANIGNTCYISSVLQCFLRINHIQVLLKEFTEQSNEEATLMRLVKELNTNLFICDSDSPVIQESMKKIVEVMWS